MQGLLQCTVHMLDMTSVEGKQYTCAQFQCCKQQSLQCMHRQSISSANPVRCVFHEHTGIEQTLSSSLLDAKVNNITLVRR